MGRGAGREGFQEWKVTESCKVPELRLAKNPQIHCVTLDKSPPFSGLQCLHFIIKRLDQVNSKFPPLAIIL